MLKQDRNILVCKIFNVGILILDHKRLFHNISSTLIFTNLFSYYVKLKDIIAFIRIFEPSHEIMVLFVLRKHVLRKRIFQMCMRSHPEGLDVWFLIGPFVYFRTSCVWKAKALARLRGCAGSHEPSLVAYVISTIIIYTE